MNTLRFGPLDDRPNLLRRGLNSSGADFKTKVINLVFQKFTFVKSPIQLGLPELFQCPPKVSPMLVHILTENENIVQIYCNEFLGYMLLISNCNEFTNIISENLIHQPLKCGGCITQPEQHDEKLKMAPVCTKSCF